ncbi:hypothetical protein [Streptomyces goshikiensis]
MTAFTPQDVEPDGTGEHGIAASFACPDSPDSPERHTRAGAR